MPSYVGSNEVSKRYVGFREVSKVYQGSDEVWNADSPIIYGFHVDPSESDPSQAVTYLADAVGKTPAAMGSSAFSYGDWADAFFMPKPCMLKYDGTVDYYLDPNDYTKKADGTASDVANSSYGGNAMMEWPLIWYKFEAGTTDGEGYFYVSNKKVDSTYHCWCNYDADDNIIPHFYTAIYNGTGTDKMRSLSGVRLTYWNGNGDVNGQTEINRALANNTTQTVEWYIDVLCDRLLINALLILISKSLNTQTKFGNGMSDATESDKYNYASGTLNNKGLFWGDITNKNHAVKVFGMENWWGCTCRRTAGLVGATNNSYAVKLTYGTADGSTANGYNTNGTGYIIISGRPNDDGFITKMKFSDKGYFPYAIQKSYEANQYWCDYGYLSDTQYATFGGNVNIIDQGGANTFDLETDFSLSKWWCATAISCKPILQSN